MRIFGIFFLGALIAAGFYLYLGARDATSSLDAVAAVAATLREENITGSTLDRETASLCASVLLGIPALRRRRELRAEPQANASLVYFTCLGVGFMAFELPTIQIMTLFQGHPTYALSVVLLGLLVAAGIGSSLMGRPRPVLVLPSGPVQSNSASYQVSKSCRKIHCVQRK